MGSAWRWAGTSTHGAPVCFVYKICASDNPQKIILWTPTYLPTCLNIQNPYNIHTCTQSNSTGKLQEKKEGSVAWLTEEAMGEVAQVLADQSTAWVVRDVESKVRSTVRCMYV